MSEALFKIGGLRFRSENEKDELKRKTYFLTDKEVSEIISLYEGGEKWNTISDKIGVSKPTISATLKKHEIKMERRRGAKRVPPIVEKKIITMYRNGFSIKEIMSYTLVSDVTIYNVLKRNPELRGNKSV